MSLEALQEAVLVLNKLWSFVAVTTGRDAVTKLYCDQARVVDSDSYVTYKWEDWIKRVPREGEPVIRGVSVLVAVPEVIVLTRFDRLPQVGITFSKYHVFKRDKYVCQYCGVQIPRVEVTLDHIIPRAKGGETSWTNCVTCCTECNALKADRTPAEANMTLRGKPGRPSWNPRQVLSSRRDLKESWTKFAEIG